MISPTPFWEVINDLNLNVSDENDTASLSCNEGRATARLGSCVGDEPVASVSLTSIAIWDLGELENGGIRKLGKSNAFWNHLVVT